MLPMLLHLFFLSIHVLVYHKDKEVEFWFFSGEDLSGDIY